MIIGIDLDNTIVDCEAMFLTLSEDLLGRSLSGCSRDEARVQVRKECGDIFWTKIQAIVYGTRYLECPPYDGAISAINLISNSSHITQVKIISHKTRMDSAEGIYNLRTIALQWIKLNLPEESINSVHFKDSIIAKQNCIVNEHCDVFLDDLPEILIPLLDHIPTPILFRKHRNPHPRLRVCDWQQFADLVCRE